jgi:hypothetical protein
VARQGGKVGETPWEVAKLSGPLLGGPAPAEKERAEKERVEEEERAIGHLAALILPLARCYPPPVRQVAVLGLAPAPQGGAQAA